VLRGKGFHYSLNLEWLAILFDKLVILFWLLLLHKGPFLIIILITPSAECQEVISHFTGQHIIFIMMVCFWSGFGYYTILISNVISAL